MPRFRNEEPEQSHYVDGDVVWVKIHNTEIWWPGEVTSSQDFRFVNASRPPFAVVAFFNEKTFEQVKSAKLIYPFQCAHKDEFIRLGTKKSDGHNMGDKFNEDVAIAEARFLGTSHQVSSLHASSSSSSRPDSLIKALLSSSTSSSLRNSSTRSSSGVPSPAANRQPEPTFRIMDIGSSNEPRRERRVDGSYDCHMCNFRTTSMDVLLIHRRGHMESSSSYSSNSTTNSSSSIRKRATRRANTTNAFDMRHLSERRSRDSTHFLPNSVRCHSRHVSIVVDASLTDEEQQRVANIAQQTMKSIERVVHPSSASSSASTKSKSRRRSIRNSSSSQHQQQQQPVPVPVPVTPVVETPRRSTQNPRDPRSQRSNQLRATMPAPQPPPPPAKPRRLTRSMSRLQQGMTTPELPPPLVLATPKRSAGRRRTLAITGAASETPMTVPRRSNPMRKTLTAVPETPVSTGRRKRTLPKNSEPKTPPITPTLSPSSTPPPIGFTPATAPAHLDAEDDEAAATTMPEEPPAPKKPRPEVTPTSTVIYPQQQQQQQQQQPQPQQNNFAGSLELQRSLMAEWCDDEMDDVLGEDEPAEHSTPNGRKSAAMEGEQEPKQPQDVKDDEPMLAERTPAKKRIRNIPKKDRRDVVRQEFDVEPDEPIVIPDSDASSNESVVFLDDEPRQRRKRHATTHHSSNGSEKSKSTSTSTPKAVNNSSCFDFEEEDDLQQQQQNEGQNGLSYRRRTQTNRLDINGKGNSEVESMDAGPEAEAGEADEIPAEPLATAPDDLFMGFDEVQQSLDEAEIAQQEEQSEPVNPQPEEPETVAEEQAEPEAEEALPKPETEAEAEAEIEGEVEGEPGDHLSLPIKERQKRIFKSRNKSTVAAPKEEDPVALVAVQEEIQQPPANGNGSAEQPELCNGKDEALTESNSIANSSESGPTKRCGKRRHKTKTESCKRRHHRCSKAKAKRQQNRLPTPVPVPEELSNNSSSTTTSSSSNNSNNSSNSTSSSNSNSNSNSSNNNSNSNSNHLSNRPSSSPGAHGSGILSPVLSSSNSCSIASNIAVISPEEARELQRSASGAGLIHAAIVDATQPVQRGGVLILEDIRLPNLYEPFGSMSSSSGSNDSRRPVHEGEVEDDEHSQDSKASEEQAVVDKLDRNDYDAEENRDAESLLNDSRMTDEVTQSPDESSLAHAPEVMHFVSQPREVLLKKREQELLRQYKADLVSGRSAEKCRKARERWSRTMRSTEEKEPPDNALQQEADVDAILEAPLQGHEEVEQVEDQYAQGQCNEEEILEHQQAEATIGDESQDSLDADLAAIELVLPSNLYNRGSRRAVSHPHANLAAVSGRKASGHLGGAQALCDADVAKAHQQLVDLREQQRRRYSPTEPTVPAAPATPPEPRRQRRRSRNPSNEMVECTFRFDVADEASCETKEVQESLTPQLCAGRICAVMTRPIPGYNHTFMLCSLANNNFTPLNNVALYLDSEKNHLVPVPREALLEPPRLADGHPLSAVFADIDILGDEAVAQAMEPVEQEADTEPDLLQVQNHSQNQNQSQDEVERMSTVQILLSDSENGEAGGGGERDEDEPVETLGIMTPLSQVAEGGALAGSSYVNEDGQLSLHDDQVESNVLQLNVNGHRLELDPSMLFSIAEQPDSCIELSVAETSPTTGVCGVGSTTAVLHARDILQAAQVYLQERDLQLVNVEDMTLDGEEAMAVPVTDLLSQALAGSQVVDDADFVDAANAGVGMLHIDTRTAGGVGVGVGVGGDSSSGVVEPGVSVVYISHALPPPAAHLTPPITARTNETNALLDQTPIMSTLENPSGGMQLRRVSPLAEGNLEDSLAVIGVTNGSGVPTSLELPITVTNPAIAPRVTAPTPMVDMVQFAPFQ
ncbi:microtubule-associated protein futsch isoform X2 [Drosophila serrata]|uniref:microtubule-associated protein futsch isoform X2 n=1 Tax=Drosophila serrata TaxID=7274 RepID=UPI000A1D0EB7|nr:microtubule-associated protein futsch isoform X2 [Drosophila serrata]